MKNIIPSAIYELLNRNGGSTNLKPLFKNRDVFYKYKIIAEESHFYKQFPSQPNRYGVEENEYDKVLKILYLIIFEKLFTNSQYRSALANGKINISLDKLLESF